jgi:hypothetical protein
LRRRRGRELIGGRTETELIDELMLEQAPDEGGAARPEDATLERRDLRLVDEFSRPDESVS